MLSVEVESAEKDADDGEMTGCNGLDSLRRHT
eukprot:COSAG02_NODE_19454_length_881_cov_0.938619_2_plen_31_part_01